MRLALAGLACGGRPSKKVSSHETICFDMLMRSMGDREKRHRGAAGSRLAIS
jgi:hypothetical protein